MVCESRKACLSGIDVGQSHHRGGRSVRGIQVQRKFVDEIAESRLRGSRAFVALGRQGLLGDAQIVAKVPDLVLLRFQIFVLRVSDNEIEKQKARPDVFGRMPAPIAKILALDEAVEVAGKEMVDTA